MLSFASQLSTNKTKPQPDVAQIWSLSANDAIENDLVSFTVK